jgi:hypothetical protein
MPNLVRLTDDRLISQVLNRLNELAQVNTVHFPVYRPCLLTEDSISKLFDGFREYVAVAIPHGVQEMLLLGIVYDKLPRCFLLDRSRHVYVAVLDAPRKLFFEGTLLHGYYNATKHQFTVLDVLSLANKTVRLIGYLHRLHLVQFLLAQRVRAFARIGQQPSFLQLRLCTFTCWPRLPKVATEEDSKIHMLWLRPSADHQETLASKISPTPILKRYGHYTSKQVGFFKVYVGKAEPTLDLEASLEEKTEAVILATRDQQRLFTVPLAQWPLKIVSTALFPRIVMTTLQGQPLDYRNDLSKAQTREAVESLKTKKEVVNLSRLLHVLGVVFKKTEHTADEKKLLAKWMHLN